MKQLPFICLLSVSFIKVSWFSIHRSFRYILIKFIPRGISFFLMQLYMGLFFFTSFLIFFASVQKCNRFCMIYILQMLHVLALPDFWCRLLKVIYYTSWTGEFWLFLSHTDAFFSCCCSGCNFPLHAEEKWLETSTVCLRACTFLSVHFSKSFLFKMKIAFLI